MSHNPNEDTSLKQMFQGMVPEGATVVEGTVVSGSPLKIRIENDDKLVVSGSVVIVPWHLTDYKTTVDVVLGGGSISSQTYVDGSHSHTCSPGSTGETPHQHALQSFNIYGATMTVYNALKTGEKVWLLKFNTGKKYFVLDRVPK